ncbi:leucine-rich repeat neuronal protein 1 [Anabas testudineus]|uniref:Ig-like domain-containing protein n=1 Tax=Anabas testudineus TaxID=64144 RepID=A0A3Q1J8P1_ANATE|nr:leucine-rich repeat neuronal protein 1 [Anabas testudineus]XP_026224715.1 leucine-rich repeat neuronal protein 1 [Anabas testudineus]XP_026224716.1 leucine-rich repeat neuronal protein 1 [Anabas testudineus]
MEPAVLFVLLLPLLTSSVCAGMGGASQGGAVLCPLQCVCETRPWYTPQSVYHQARTVDCNELHLQRVPTNISSDTQVLLLQSNNISSITSELQCLTNLTELDLSQNHFTQVSSMGLSSLGRLVTLYLEENHIEELEDFSLKNLSSLEELYINHNRISSIGPKAFAGLTNLLRLHLNSNRLVAIDSRWFEALPSLEILMIGENPILGLEEKNFLPLSRLHSLVLAGMGLASVPSAAFLGLDYLESLSFYDNRLKSVPRDALSVLPNLKFLDLNRNPISRIQQGDFQNLQHLEELSLNNMDELLMVERAAFHNLPEITKLEICNNPQLSYIDPQAFSDLSSIRTLLLYNNQLSLLSGDVLSSLPSIEEVSLHTNPLRCDCLSSWGPHLGNQSHLKLLESSITLCSSPPHMIGRELQEVVAIRWGGADSIGGGANSCLPHISPHAFPPAMNVSAGQPITLECWADADPAPQFYWVTPNGDKVSSEAVAAPIVSEEGRGLSKKKKHRVSEPGALVIEHAELSDTGVYTCVAWNTEGADTKSISVFVDSQGSVGWWSDRESQQGMEPSREQPWLGNSSSRAASLVVVAKVVHAQSVVLEWKLYPSFEGESQQDAPLPLPWWASATVHIDNPQISYTAKVPVDVQEYNLTHLLPATEYHVCLTVSSSPPPSTSPSSSPSSSPSPVFPSSAFHTSCLNITTKEAGFSVEMVASQRSSVALAAVMGSMFALSIMALLVVYMGRRVQQHKSCGHSLKKYMQHATSIPLNELYPPLITLWESEAEKDKDEKEEEERERGEREVEAGGSQIDTTKTYMW